MDTQTGRIYDAGEMRTLAQALDEWEGDREGARAALREQQLRERGLTMADAAALAEARIVPVSDHVAQKMKLGERELERRQRRRAAAKQARKRSRPR